MDILICSDNKGLTEYLLKGIEREGHNVEPAASAMDAVRKVLTRGRDVLILNLDIDEENGPYLIPVVNALDENLFIITVTKKDSLELQRLTRRGKIFFHAVWPQDGEAVLAAIKNIELLMADKQVHGKRSMTAASPGYLKKRIRRYVAGAGTGWAQGLRRNAAKSGA